jgi:hypothetical protein|tara:strand:+ start:12 stop:242 length:231 start_codon:yes stop_codon:yes gene_type:complete
VIDLSSNLDPETVPDDWWLERMRMHRDNLLAGSDWTQAADDPTGNAAAWATYRQELRDAPASWTPASTWTPPAPPS